MLRSAARNPRSEPKLLWSESGSRRLPRAAAQLGLEAALFVLDLALELPQGAPHLAAHCEGDLLDQRPRQTHDAIREFLIEAPRVNERSRPPIERPAASDCLTRTAVPQDDPRQEQTT